jgi:hypothetical protein
VLHLEHSFVWCENLDSSEITRTWLGFERLRTAFSHILVSTLQVYLIGRTHDICCKMLSIQSSSANRRFDLSILPQYVQRTRRSSFLGQWAIANAHALAMFTGSVTSARHSGSVVVQSYQRSLLFVTLCNFLYNIITLVKMWALQWKANAKTGFVNRQIANRRFMK